jgi:4-amino-4-deoxy-L-arabinose transferase-like glycosyltransferase
MRRSQSVAVSAALVSAVLYALIGFGVLDVRTSAEGTGSDPLGFGLVAGVAFLLVAAIVAALRRRSAWLLAAVFTGLVIVGYFVTADIRQPPVEPWGLTLKAVQSALLVALVYLTVRGRRVRSAAPTG